MVTSLPLDLRALDAQQRGALGLQSPAAFYVTGEDALQLSVINMAAGVTVVMSGRFLGLDGTPSPFQWSLVPATDRSLSSLVKSLGEGWLLDVTVNVAAGAPVTGQTWARLQIVRGLTNVGIVLGTLCSGYITAVQPATFPRGLVRSSLDGAGVIRSITGTNPAAGANISETVPTGARWRLLSVLLRFVTEATAGNRDVTLVIDDGANVIANISSGFTHAASLTYDYSFAGEGSRYNGTVSNFIVVPLPRLTLLAGYRIRSATGGIQPLDDYGAPQLLVEEWQEGA